MTIETTGKDRVSGRFVKGHPGGGHRQRGQTNKITRDLKEGIIDAAVSVGSDGKGKGGLTGYLTMLARRHPKAFSSLLGRLMPLQVNGNLGSFIGSVNIMAVPPNKYISTEEAVAQMPVDADNVVKFKQGDDDDQYEQEA